MAIFKSAKYLASWAGVSPGNNESAGKKTTKTTKGNKVLKNNGSRMRISHFKAKQTNFCTLK